ncbi:MAG: bifunctional pyr operon transcriptional regulator/uracil phosphoribosyltransferase PyrR [Bacteroidia bacterium]|jgi:pyrimidine operon attenuation protein / uracil phosphoribosyltransferase
MNTNQRLIVPAAQLSIILQRLTEELVEQHGGFQDTVIIGLQPRGTFLAERLHQLLQARTAQSIKFGKLDVTFYRDDFRRRDEPLIPSATEIDFSIEGKKVVLIDDVLYTGRTIRAGLDALLDFGRPERVELLVLVERLYTQEFPIQPDYCGRRVNTLNNERITVSWIQTTGEDNIWIHSN